MRMTHKATMARCSHLKLNNPEGKSQRSQSSDIFKTIRRKPKTCKTSAAVPCRFGISTATRVEHIQSAGWHHNKTRIERAPIRRNALYSSERPAVTDHLSFRCQFCFSEKSWMAFDVAHYDGMLRACGWAGGGTVTWQGCIRQRDAGARRLAAPDRALQEGLVWCPPAPSASLRRDKSQRPVERCELRGFCA